MCRGLSHLMRQHTDGPCFHSDVTSWAQTLLNVRFLLYFLEKRTKVRDGEDLTLSYCSFYCYYLIQSCFYPAKGTLLNVICTLSQGTRTHSFLSLSTCDLEAMVFLFHILPGGGATWPTQTREAEQNRQLYLLLPQVIYICWVTESERTFLFVTCRIYNKSDTFFSLLGTQTWTASTAWPACLAFKYSAGASCIRTMCSVSLCSM